MQFVNLYSSEMTDGYHLNLGGKKIPLLSGEIQFFRMDPSSWERCVETAKAFGLPMISTYLSWRRFEKKEGAFDFIGSSDPRLNLKEFLEICDRKGMFVILKPGPWICAEETNGGYPEWLVARDELQVLNAADEAVMGYNPPFESPIPSLFHPDYWKALTRWLDAVDSFIRPYVYPSGPIVLMQLDNEPCYTFHDRILASDYNPVITGSQGVFQNWLREKYARDEDFRQMYGTEAKAIAELEAPRSVEASISSALLMDWALFKEWSLAEHVNRIGLRHRQNGIEIPFTINFNLHPQLSTPNNWALLEKASGLGGFDFYPELPMRWSCFTKMVMALTYSRLVNKIPWSPEMMTGIWRYEGQLNQPGCIAADDYRYLYLTCLAYGLKGMNFYMLADRDHWIDSPIDGEGKATRYAESVIDVIKLIHAVPNFLDYRIKTNVALLFNHGHAREAYCLNETPDLFAGSSGAQAYKTFEETFDYLLNWNLTPTLVDPEVRKLSASETPILIAIVSGGLPSELQSYLSEGGTLICVTLNEAALSGVVDASNCHFCSVRNLEKELFANLLRLNVHPAISLGNPDLLSVVHSNAEDRLLFLINPTDAEQIAEIPWGGRQVFRDVIDCNEKSSISSQQVVLRARSVLVFRFTEKSS